VDSQTPCLDPKYAPMAESGADTPYQSTIINSKVPDAQLNYVCEQEERAYQTALHQMNRQLEGKGSRETQC